MAKECDGSRLKEEGTAASLRPVAWQRSRAGPSRRARRVTRARPAPDPSTVEALARWPGLGKGKRIGPASRLNSRRH